jgi:hypothetical protein
MTKFSKAVLLIGLAYLVGIAVLYVVGDDGIAAAFLTLPGSLLIFPLMYWIPPGSALEPAVISWTGNFIALLVSAALNVAGVYVIVRLLART